MAGPVIRGGAAAADGALWALGVSVQAVRRQVRLLREATTRAQQAADRRYPSQPPAGNSSPPSLSEALQVARAYLGTARILPGLSREAQSSAAQALMRLAGDLSRIRQQLTGLLPGYPGPGEPGLTGVTDTGPAGPGLEAELLGRIRSVESRLSAVELRVGTGPDMAELDQQIAQARGDRQAAADAQDYESAAMLRDRERRLLAQKTSRQHEWAAAHLDLPALAEELSRTHDEVAQLRGLLSEQDAQPRDALPGDSQPQDGVT